MVCTSTARLTILAFAIARWHYFGNRQERNCIKGRIMKALVYHGPKKVSVDTVPDPKIEKLTDVLVKLTTTNICGSDLHMYEGRTDVKKGKILGHENLGEVVDVG